MIFYDIASRVTLTDINGNGWDFAIATRQDGNTDPLLILTNEDGDEPVIFPAAETLDKLREIGMGVHLPAPLDNNPLRNL